MNCQCFKLCKRNSFSGAFQDLEKTFQTSHAHKSSSAALISAIKLRQKGGIECRCDGGKRKEQTKFIGRYKSKEGEKC